MDSFLLLFYFFTLGMPFHCYFIMPMFQQFCIHVNVPFFFFVFLGPHPQHLVGDSQARGPIRAVAAGLHHSHSNMGSEPCLKPTPQLLATPDPQPTEQGQGSNPQPYGSQSESLTTVPRWELLYFSLDPRFFSFHSVVSLWGNLKEALNPLSIKVSILRTHSSFMTPAF